MASQPMHNSNSARYAATPAAALAEGGASPSWNLDHLYPGMDSALFKADIGSVGVGAAQIQGVWLTPRLRGQGIAKPLVAAVTESVLRDIAGLATLYVNDYNAAARATYLGLGYREVGSFTTVLL